VEVHECKDDLERTLRYFHGDGGVLRYVAWQVNKAHPPGTFGAKKGGISAGRDKVDYDAEGERAVRRLVEEFDMYIRLPSPSDKAYEKTTLGVVWAPDSNLANLVIYGDCFLKNDILLHKRTPCAIYPSRHHT
jgi:hypothetical protein